LGHRGSNTANVLRVFADVTAMCEVLKTTCSELVAAVDLDAGGVGTLIVVVLGA